MSSIEVQIEHTRPEESEGVLDVMWMVQAMRELEHAEEWSRAEFTRTLRRVLGDSARIDAAAEMVEIFWAEMSPKFAWSVLPTEFVFRVYQGWMAERGEAHLSLGDYYFHLALGDALVACPRWTNVGSAVEGLDPTDVRWTHRPTEPLIERYGLTESEVGLEPDHDKRGLGALARYRRSLTARLETYSDGELASYKSAEMEQWVPEEYDEDREEYEADLRREQFEDAVSGPYTLMRYPAGWVEHLEALVAADPSDTGSVEALAFALENPKYRLL